MVVMWLIDKLPNLWSRARGVTNETYTTRCTRCGYNGRIHLVGCGCRRLCHRMSDLMTRRVSHD